MGAGDDSLIGGFIVTGTESQDGRASCLGTVPGSSVYLEPVADPVLTLYDSSGAAVATNDDWESDPGASQIDG